MIGLFENHEFYGTDIDETRARLAHEGAGAGIHLLDPGMVRIEGVRFIGATHWTDLEPEGRANTIGTHLRVGDELMDIQGGIEHVGKDFTTTESVQWPRADRHFIEREFEQAEHAGERAAPARALDSRPHARSGRQEAWEDAPRREPRRERTRGRTGMQPWVLR